MIRSRGKKAKKPPGLDADVWIRVGVAGGSGRWEWQVAGLWDTSEEVKTEETGK